MESRKQWRGKVVRCQQQVGSRFLYGNMSKWRLWDMVVRLLTLSVDEDLGTSAIGSNEYGIGIDLRVGPTRSTFRSLEQLTHF